jgi:hypothetical protein
LEALALGKQVFALNRGGTPELAIYERFPGQLRLFDSLPQLTKTLIDFREKSEFRQYEEFTDDISRVIPPILHIYQMDLNEFHRR